jgi:hypothetical protein
VVVALVLLLLLEAVLVLVLLEAEAVDSRTAAVALLLAAEREFLPPPLSFVSFPFRFLPFLLLLWFSFPPFSFLSVHSSSSPLSLSFGFFRSPPLSSVFFRFFLPVSSPPFPSVLGVLFIEPRAWLCCGAWGATGRSAIGHDCQGSAPLPGFLASARWVVGHCVRSVGSRRESGRQKFKKKLPFFLLPRCMFGGKKKDEQCRSKRHRSALSFFFSFF